VEKKHSQKETVETPWYNLCSTEEERITKFLTQAISDVFMDRKDVWVDGKCGVQFE
jgi:hypothetical protein